MREHWHKITSSAAEGESCGASTDHSKEQAESDSVRGPLWYQPAAQEQGGREKRGGCRWLTQKKLRTEEQSKTPPFPPNSNWDSPWGGLCLRVPCTSGHIPARAGDAQAHTRDMAHGAFEHFCKRVHVNDCRTNAAVGWALELACIELG
eukprot:1161348-Pelagomonas_calceolata.AAC.9